jgi:nucleoside-diphosphate-sugar epimerase
MSVIVTGATGFIGRHLVSALAEAGEEVRCLTRGASTAESRPKVSFHRVAYERSDLSLSDEIFAGATHVYHLAGATKAVSAGAFDLANVQTTARLLARITASVGVPRFVYVSSQAAAGPARDASHPKSENEPNAPIEDYGRSKLAAEGQVRTRSGKLPWTVVRPVAVYGPGDRDFLAIFAMAKRGVAIYPGTKRASLNTIFVTDLVRGIIAAASSAEAVGKTYFLGDDTVQKWTEIYGTIAEVVGQAPTVDFNVPRSVISAAGRVGDVVAAVAGRPTLVSRSKSILATPKYWLCSSAQARADFGFRTPTSLREGMRMTYDWYLKHRWL